MKYFFSIAIIVLFFSACQSIDVYENFTSFKEHSWKNTENPCFTFNISDTNSQYNFYFVLRNEDAYSYKNIWLDIKIKEPDTTISIRREFILADNKKWLGTAMDDIIEHRIPFNTAPTKLKKGKYEFTISQIMREDPLPHILAAGIRVQKIH